ncbi:stage II sporulation protein P [Metabacillus herbersteinensis]|uniref:Stage II sporulation protein P n=1 Tax=Metabacillus herbersteinensis TaxID=283816 RepID=A0ABV6GMR2_9BACI
MKKIPEKLKNKPIIAILLILSIILFLLCTLSIFVLASVSQYEEKISGNAQFNQAFSVVENILLNRKPIHEEVLKETEPDENDHSLTDYKRDRIKTSHVELSPSMDMLLKENEVSIKDLEGMSRKLESLTEQLDEPIHSTFGKEVVYVYHSHSRESFLPYLGKEDPEAAFHSEVNITLVGQMLENSLQQRGIGTQSDSTDVVQILSDRGLTYNNSYYVSREIAMSAMEENKNLEILLDIHRDSLRREATTISINGESHAKLLFVVGTGHRDYKKNKRFSEAINTLLEKNYHGLSKGVLEKDNNQGNGVYNQDLSPNSVIVEIGGVDNNIEEINRTVRILADMISEYYWHGETGREI